MQQQQQERQQQQPPTRGSYRNWYILMVVGLSIALAITLFSPFASSDPDGLEKVADDKGFLQEAKDPSYEIIPDYTFPGVENERLATILSGVVGVLIVAALGLGAGWFMRASARSRQRGQPSSRGGAGTRAPDAGAAGGG